MGQACTCESVIDQAHEICGQGKDEAGHSNNNSKMNLRLELSQILEESNDGHSHMNSQNAHFINEHFLQQP